MADLSDKTRDSLLVAIACGLRVLLKAAAAGELNEGEVTALAQMAAHTGTVIDAALEEMGL